MLAELIGQTWARFPKDYAWRSLSRQEDAISLNTEQHRQIIAALEARRPNAAMRAMSEHVLRSGELLICYLDRQAFWGPAAAPDTQEEERHA
jgi:DNA-binding FadR family transcriptional regulator